MKKWRALELLECNNQELASILNITPSYLSRFDELNEFHTSVVEGRHAIIEAKHYKDMADLMNNKCDILMKKINMIQGVINNEGN